MRAFWVILTTLAVAALSGAVPASAQVPELAGFTSRHYTVYTNLPKAEAAEWARHMDAVYTEFGRRFAAFRPRNNAPNNLYLFKTQDEYLRFLGSHGIDGTNSGGMFVVRGQFSGLLTWTRNKSKATTLQTLQHEGFHQFAYKHLGPELPIWVNEGLAQYFEDGLLLRSGLKLGIVNAIRTAMVKDAIANDRTIDFTQLLGMTPQRWSNELVTNRSAAAMNYAQSWSICYFLIHAENGRYRKALDKYLVDVAQGKDPVRAFREIFGNNVNPFRQRWEAWAQDVEPDPHTAALQKMEFLGQALRSIAENGGDMPTSMDELRERLTAGGFKAWTIANEVRIDFDGADPDSYRFTNSAGNLSKFELLEASRADLPPRILARGLRPEPTLVWSKDADGELVQEVEFR